MPLFGTISEFLAPLISPSRRSNRQNPIPAPPSDATSDELQRTQVSGVSDAPRLGSFASVIQSEIGPPIQAPDVSWNYALSIVLIPSPIPSCVYIE
jgi:hypothetical protein